MVLQLEDLNTKQFGPLVQTVQYLDLDAINEANNLCNEYGLDTISTGTTIATAMELYEKGYIKDEDIEADGISLKWGDPKAIVGWTRKMG